VACVVGTLIYYALYVTVSDTHCKEHGALERPNTLPGDRWSIDVIYIGAETTILNKRDQVSRCWLEPPKAHVGNTVQALGVGRESSSFGRRLPTYHYCILNVPIWSPGKRVLNPLPAFHDTAGVAW
jgi:hypothetical protein